MCSMVAKQPEYINEYGIIHKKFIHKILKQIHSGKYIDICNDTSMVFHSINSVQRLLFMEA